MIGGAPTQTRGRKVVAAIADDSAAAAVLSSASAIAGLFSATVQAVHAGEGNATVSDAARKAGVTLTTIAGGAVEAIKGVAADEDVAAVVIGARGTPAGGQPAGSTAIALVTSLEKPVAVVPPNAVVGGGIQTVLVPLDGTVLSAEALREVVELASRAQLQIVVAHVYLERSLPAFSDHLPHEVRAWTEEFIARHCPSAAAATLELRVVDGEPGEHVLDILLANHCDLVALGWSQNLAQGRAAVVRRMLSESPVPVLLMPVDARARLAPVDAGPAIGAVNGG